MLRRAFPLFILTSLAAASACTPDANSALCPAPESAGSGGEQSISENEPPSPAALISIADPGFPAVYAETSGFRRGRPASISFTPDGTQILFLRSGARDGVRNLYAYTLATQEERVILTAAQVLQGAVQELSPEERALRERLRMTASGITSYDLSPDGEQILVPLSGRLYLVNLAEGGVRELASDGGYANDPRFSPNGRSIACVRDGDLYVVDVRTGRQRRLTRKSGDNITNGLSEFVAQEEMGRLHGYWWSPDSRSLVYQETDSEPVERLYAANPIDPSAQPHGAAYPRAGTDNARVRLGIIGARGGRTRWIDWDAERYPYLATVKWSAETPLALVVQDRLQQHEAVLTVDPRNGRTTTVHEESDPRWLNLDQSMPRFLDATHFLWSTERDGFWQLELRTISDGTSTGVFLTEPAAGYAGLAHVGPETLWIETRPVPGENQLAMIPFQHVEADDAPAAWVKGTLAIVTAESGWHSGTFGPDGRWVHAMTPVHGAKTWNVRQLTAEGEQALGTLVSAAEAADFVPQVEYVTVGERELRAAIIRPRNFEEGRQYPVLVSVYGGPGHVQVGRQDARWIRAQWQADHGYVVVSVDGRGTPGRGREWERSIYQNVIDGPLEDQVAGIRALGERFAEMDMARVGIYGWSFGGYFSAMATMRHPELFRVGVAGAPVCDWADYDTHYTERFMGLPADNVAGYEASNVLTYASGLRQPLMIIHGTSDDNVYFVHALKMSDALMRAGADYEFVVLAGATHMVHDPAVAGALQERIMGFLAAGLE